MDKRSNLLLIIVLFSIFSFSLCGCSACAKKQWQQVYEAYTQEESRFVYQSFNVTIEDFDSFINNKDKIFNAMIEEEDYLKLHGFEAPAEIYRKDGYYFVDTSIKVLEDAGFYADIKEDTVIKFTVNDYIGWDGWAYPVFAVEIDGRTYLDFDIGKENVLNYIKERLENT